jgi:hypothetical protein
MAARRTAAAAVLAEYQREVAASLRTPGTGPEWPVWASRLAAAVRQLVEQPGDEPGPLEQLGQRGILRQALTDAIAYRDPSGICPDCDVHPAGLCSDHAEDLDKTDAYLALARQLGLEMEQ